jgi:uncharacterized membrane protein YccC
MFALAIVSVSAVVALAVAILVLTVLWSRWVRRAVRAELEACRAHCAQNPQPLPQLDGMVRAKTALRAELEPVVQQMETLRAGLDTVHRMNVSLQEHQALLLSKLEDLAGASSALAQTLGHQKLRSDVADALARAVQQWRRDVGTSPQLNHNGTSEPT